MKFFLLIILSINFLFSADTIANDDDEINHKFEFHVLNLKHNITLDMDKFIECYTLFLKD